MTHTSTEQPEALRLARKFEEVGFIGDHRFAKDHWCRQAAAELRRQHARIEELEAQLSTSQSAAQGLEQDAARYQALVESGSFAPSPFDNGMWGLRVNSVPSTKAELDAAVDRVIAAQAKQGDV